MFFGNQAAPGGYLWVIPRSDSMVNVGFGLRYSHLAGKVSLTRFLNRFIQTNSILAKGTQGAKIESRIGASIPVGGPLHRTYTKRVVLVGDAAGHVMATNGGGIPTALVGGEIAGNVVSKHLHQKTGSAILMSITMIQGSNFLLLRIIISRTIFLPPTIQSMGSRFVYHQTTF